MSLAEDFSTVVRRPKLADLVIDTLRQRMAAGEYRAGTKLPTEQQMTTIFGVSRTVVREAIAALSADGLVQSRQGAGVYVVGTASTPFAEIGAEKSNKVSVAINVLEVRMGIEIEAAGLAARRRSNSQDAEILEAWQDFNRLLKLGAPTGKADFAFHRSVAAATNNPFYVEVLDGLGSRTIPCDIASPWSAESALSHDYQAGLQQEHLTILEAISAQDADAAREAMRQHLSQSLERYRKRLRQQSS
jgi:GntR family transcriptional repressor for pyruvate dehydrogenase complex